jgi:nicotinamidase-related amidase
MTTLSYQPRITALLCVDLYNDFLSEGGKLWPWVKDIAAEVNLLNNLRAVVRTAREVGIAVYHVPHHRWEPGDYINWKYPSPYQLGAAQRQAFAKDTWGGTFHDDFQVQRLPEYRPRPSAEAVGQGKDHPRRSASEHLS